MKIKSKKYCIGIYNSKSFTFYNSKYKNSYFQIGSCTKSFVALCILLIEQEYSNFNIKQTLGDWLPQYSLWKNITIEQLLNMSSGIPYSINSWRMKKDIFKFPHKYYSPQKIISYAFHPLYFTPGTDWRYCNTNYIILELLIKKITGHSLKHQLYNRIFIPFQLKQTYYTEGWIPLFLKPTLIRGHYYKNKIQAPIHNLSILRGAGGIISTPYDLLKWTIILINHSLFYKLKSWISIPSKGIKYGLGIAQFKSSQGNIFLGHNGQTLGYNSFFGFCPQKNIYICGLANKSIKNEMKNKCMKLIEI